MILFPKKILEKQKEYWYNKNRIRKNKGEEMNQKKLEILRERERERERELDFKPQAKENLVLFVISKLYMKYQSLKDGLCREST